MMHRRGVYDVRHLVELSLSLKIRLMYMLRILLQNQAGGLRILSAVNPDLVSL